MDDLALDALQAMHDRFLKELNAHANGERGIQPSEADIAALRSRLADLKHLIARKMQ